MADAFIPGQSQSVRVNGDEMLMTSLIPLFLASAGVLHGLHGYEALPAVQHGQQPLLRPAAAGGRTLPSEPVVRVAPSAQIPNEHAGEGPNGHGCHAVPSTAGVSTLMLRIVMVFESAPPPPPPQRRLCTRFVRRMFASRGERSPLILFILFSP